MKRLAAPFFKLVLGFLLLLPSGLVISSLLLVLVVPVVVVVHVVAGTLLGLLGSVGQARTGCQQFLTDVAMLLVFAGRPLLCEDWVPQELLGVLFFLRLIRLTLPLDLQKTHSDLK